MTDDSGEPRGYDEAHYRTTKGGLSRWVERFFFAGIELTVLSTPAFVPAVLFQFVYPDAVPLAGLSALGLGTAALTLYRAGVVDVGDWPRLGEFSSVPIRFVYFTSVFLAATFGVAAAADAVGSLALAFLAGGVVEAVGLAGFPRVYRAVHGEPTHNPSQRV